jgi:hypothetical protein
VSDIDQGLDPDLDQMVHAEQAPEERDESDDHDLQLRALDDDTTRTDSLAPLEGLDSEDVGDDDEDDWRVDALEDDDQPE